MISGRDIVKTIQQVPVGHNSIPFFVSLANHAFWHGGLTERQERAYLAKIESLPVGACVLCGGGHNLSYEDDLGALCELCRIRLSPPKKKTDVWKGH